MRRNGWLLGSIVAGLLGGCVERRYVVTTDPPGAMVLVDGKPLGASPADDHFIYYGDREFTLIKDGYQTMKVKQKFHKPWYQYIGLDFISENLVPWHIEDVQRFHYCLEPLHAVQPEQLIQQAEMLRARGRTVGPWEMEKKPGWFGFLSRKQQEDGTNTVSRKKKHKGPAAPAPDATAPPPAAAPPPEPPPPTLPPPRVLPAPAPAPPSIGPSLQPPLSPQP
jgi:hypothetical protein